MTSNADSRGAQFRAPGSSAKRSALEERWARRMSAGPGDDAPFPAMEIMRAIKIAAQPKSETERAPEGDQERGWEEGRSASAETIASEPRNHSRNQDRRTAEIGREAGLSRGSTSHARENKQTIRKGKSSASDGIIHAIKLARRWSVASSGRAPRRRRPASHRRTTAQPPQRLENRAKLRTRIRPLKRSRLQPRQAPRAGPSPAGRRRHRPAKRAPSPARRRPR